MQVRFQDFNILNHNIANIMQSNILKIVTVTKTNNNGIYNRQ